MKENKYDDEVFYNKYSMMERSKKGLEGAGEWYRLRELLPDFNGKRVLDLGCGYGWHCAYASQHGALSVVGCDISVKMINTAKAKNSAANITYMNSAIEDLDFPDDSFDIVFSSLALHYISDYKSLVNKIYGWLCKGGTFIFSAEHPVFTAEGSEDWIYGKDGKIMCFPVDNYYYEGKRDSVFLGEHVVKYHRTLTTYLDTLLCGGFSVKRVVEPSQAPESLKIPGMADEMRRPMMIIISAVKTF